MEWPLIRNLPAGALGSRSINHYKSNYLSRNIGLAPPLMPLVEMLRIADAQHARPLT
jgi:hypothetical protein